MMGHNHFKAGAVTWMMGAAGLAALGVPLAVVPTFGGATLAGYAAKVPDIDCEGSTVSRTWGMPLHVTYQTVRWLVVSLVWLRYVVVTRGWRGRLRDASRTARRVDRRWFRHRGITHSLAFAVGAGILTLPILHVSTRLWFVPLGVMVGCVIHLLTDLPTLGEIPLLAPWSWRGFALRLFKVNGWFERNVISRVLYGALVVMPFVVLLVVGLRQPV